MMIDDKLLTHRRKLSLFFTKLSKRPYKKPKDCPIRLKPWVKTTTIYTLLFVTYVSIGETAIILREFFSKSALSQSVPLQIKYIYFVVSVDRFSSATFLVQNI
jgi:hypothetical protein